MLTRKRRHRVKPRTGLHRAAFLLAALFPFVGAIDLALNVSLLFCRDFGLFGEGR
jgi:hypothetical protein